MNTIHDHQKTNIPQISFDLLAEALKALQRLTYSADGDIFTDAPECKRCVSEVQNAILQAYSVLGRIREALEVEEEALLSTASQQSQRDSRSPWTYRGDPNLHPDWRHLGWQIVSEVPDGAIIARLSDGMPETFARLIAMAPRMARMLEMWADPSSPEDVAGLIEMSESILTQADGKDIEARPEKLALRILDEAEEAFLAKSMAADRAASGNWQPPETIPDFLFWIEDEAQMQEQQGENHPDEAADRRIYFKALQGIASEIRALGFDPSPAPWASTPENGGRSQ